MASDDKQILGKGLSDKSTVEAKTDMSSLPQGFTFDPTLADPNHPNHRNLEVGFGDMAKGVGAGALDFVAGVGQLSENITGYGEGLRDLASSGADALVDSMSEDAQLARQRKIVDEDDTGSLKVGDGAAEPAVWAMKFAEGIGSMIPMVGSGGIAGVGVKAAVKSQVTKSMIKRGVTKELAEETAERTVQILADRAATTTAVSVGGAGSLGSASNEAREQTIAMSHDFLAENSKTYRDNVARLAQDPQYNNLSSTELLDLAREQTGDFAALELSKDPMAIAGTAAAMVGDKVLFGALRGAGGLGIRAGAAQGAGSEAVTEAVETGAQRYANNQVSNEVLGTDIDPMKGVLSESIEGGIIGAGIGGTMGAAGGVFNHITGQVEPSKPATPSDKVSTDGTNPTQPTPDRKPDAPDTPPSPTQAEATPPSMDEESFKQALFAKAKELGQNEANADLRMFQAARITDGEVIDNVFYRVADEAGIDRSKFYQYIDTEQLNQVYEAAQQERKQATAQTEQVQPVQPDTQAQPAPTQPAPTQPEAAQPVQPDTQVQPEAAQPVQPDTQAQPVPEQADQLNTILRAEAKYPKEMARLREQIDSLTDEQFEGVEGAQIEKQVLDLANQKVPRSKQVKRQSQASNVDDIEIQQSEPQPEPASQPEPTQPQPEPTQPQPEPQPEPATTSIVSKPKNSTDQTDELVHDGKDLFYIKRTVDTPKGKVAITGKYVMKPNQYKEIYGKDGAILNFELKGDGATSSSNYQSVSGVLTSDTSRDNLETLTDRVLKENSYFTDTPPDTTPTETQTVKPEIVDKAKQVIFDTLKTNQSSNPKAKLKLKGVRNAYKAAGFTAKDLQQALGDKTLTKFESEAKAEFEQQIATPTEQAKEPGANVTPDLSQPIKNTNKKPSVEFRKNQRFVTEQGEIFETLGQLQSTLDDSSMVTVTVNPDQLGQKKRRVKMGELRQLAKAEADSQQANKQVEEADTSIDQPKTNLSAKEHEVELDRHRDRWQGMGRKERESAIGWLNDGKYVDRDFDDLSYVAKANIGTFIDANPKAVASDNLEGFDVIGKAVIAASGQQGFMQNQIRDHLAYMQNESLKANRTLEDILNEDTGGDLAKEEAVQLVKDLSPEFFAKEPSSEKEKSTLDKLDDSISDAEAKAWAELQELLNAQKGTLNSGVNPIIVAAFAKAASFTVAKGSVKFAKWVRDTLAAARKMGFSDEQVEDLKPFLKETYNAMKASPEKYDLSDDLVDGMSSSKELRQIKDIDKFINSTDLARTKAPNRKQPEPNPYDLVRIKTPNRKKARASYAQLTRVKAKDRKLKAKLDRFRKGDLAALDNVITPLQLQRYSFDKKKEFIEYFAPEKGEILLHDMITFVDGRIVDALFQPKSNKSLAEYLGFDPDDANFYIRSATTLGLNHEPTYQLKPLTYQNFAWELAPLSGVKTQAQAMGVLWELATSPEAGKDFASKAPSPKVESESTTESKTEVVRRKPFIDEDALIDVSNMNAKELNASIKEHGLLAHYPMDRIESLLAKVKTPSQPTRSEIDSVMDFYEKLSNAERNLSENAAVRSDYEILELVGEHLERFRKTYNIDEQGRHPIIANRRLTEDELNDIRGKENYDELYVKKVAEVYFDGLGNYAKAHYATLPKNHKTLTLPYSKSLARLLGRDLESLAQYFGRLPSSSGSKPMGVKAYLEQYVEHVINTDGEAGSYEIRKQLYPKLVAEQEAESSAEWNRIYDLKQHFTSELIEQYERQNLEPFEFGGVTYEQAIKDFDLEAKLKAEGIEDFDHTTARNNFIKERDNRVISREQEQEKQAIKEQREKDEAQAEAIAKAEAKDKKARNDRITNNEGEIKVGGSVYAPEYGMLDITRIDYDSEMVFGTWVEWDDLKGSLHRQDIEELGYTWNAKPAEDSDHDRTIDSTRHNELAQVEREQVSTNESRRTSRTDTTDGASRESQTASSSAERGSLQDGRVGRDQGTAQPHFHLRELGDVSAKTAKERVSANVKAIQTLKQILAEKRPATSFEKLVLAQYTGWGGIGNDVFNPDSNKKYAQDAREQLDKLLTRQEKDGILESLATAFYTSKEVADAMWAGVEAFNLADGGRINVLEPTVGSGNFIGYQPEALRDRSNWSASEIDTITGNIARLLYDDANILVKGFEKAPFKNGAFSLAIGNPPFGSLTINDSKDAELSGKKIHNYVLSKSAKLLHENGLLMMVISNGFMDTNLGHQAELNKQLEFVGAIRLPNNAFKNTNTEVVTDIVVMRKRTAGEEAKDSAWLDTDGQLNGIKVNKYFELNPDNVLGTVSSTGTMYRENSMTVEPLSKYSGEGALGQAIQERLESMAQSNQREMTDSYQQAINNNVTLVESDLSVGGMMLDADGNVRLRIEDNEDGAVVTTVDENSIWDNRGKAAQAIVDAIHSGNSQALNRALGKVVSTKTFRPSGSYNTKPFNLAMDYFYNEIVDAPREGKGKMPRSKFEKEATKANVLESLEKAIDGWKLGKDFPRLRSLLSLRNTTLALLQAEREDASNIEQLRKQLNTEYDALVKTKKGTKTYVPSVSDSLGLLNGDIGIESGLDHINPSTNTAVKADLLKERQLYPIVEPTSADSLDDAVIFSIQSTGRLNPDKVSKLLGVDESEALDMLTAGDRPYLMTNHVTGKLEFIDEYLSGNVKEKHQAALDSGDEKGAKLLKEAFPKPVKEVKPTIRAPWADEEIFADFIRALGISNAKAEINKQSGQITTFGVIKGNLSEIGAKFKNNYVNVLELVNLAANGKTKTIYDRIGEQMVKNEEATKKVNALINSMAETFGLWAKSADGILPRLTENYNSRVNVWAERKWNGSLYMKPQGQRIIEGFGLRPTQLNGVMRMVMQDEALLDHTVGAGKTFTSITGVMERRRLGLTKKPLVVVPNHIIGDFKKDFNELYPSANILFPSKKDLSTKERKQFLSRIATGSYDAIIIGHSHLKSLPNDIDSEVSVMNEQIDALRAALEEQKQKASSAGGRSPSVNQMEKRIKNLRDKINKRKEKAQSGSDDLGYSFKDLGVDYMVVDEAHEFKNLFYTTSNDRVVGMNAPEGSDKAFDLLVKLRHIQNKEAVPNGGVTFMTGTPVSNSLVELYTILNYLARPKLNSLNIGQYDAFAGSFLETATAMEYTPQGTIKERMVLKGIANGKGLSDLYRQVADVVSLEDLHRIHEETVGTRFPVPRVKTGGRQINSAPPSKDMMEFKDYMIARQEAIDGASDKKQYAKIDNSLWLMSDGRKAGLDIRLVDPLAKRESSGKIVRSAEEIKRLYDAWSADKGTQLVFSDMGTPVKGASTRAKNAIVAALKSIMSEVEAKKWVAAKEKLGKEANEQWLYSDMAQEAADKINAQNEVERLDEDTMEKTLEALRLADSESTSADTGFSVYDDLKTVLVELGIPENEIAFIHDYGTDQKAALFEQVNKGDIRVLIGSTPKMGAGTNVQERLVGLHHLDAPWRPSDMEQREGRIIRQKNSLYKRDPDGFEVEIIAYTTEGSSDVVMWQVLERKASAINGFRLGSVIDDVNVQDEDTASFAALKAEASGNPIYKEKLKAEKDLINANNEFIGVSSSIGSAESIVSEFAETSSSLDRAQRETEKAADYLTSEWATAALEEAKQDAKDYTDALSSYDRQMLEYSEMSKDERKERNVKRPVKPKRLSVVDYEDNYSNAIKKAIDQAQTEIDKSRKLHEQYEKNKTPLAARDSVYEGNVIPLGNGMSIQWDVTYSSITTTPTADIVIYTTNGTSNPLVSFSTRAANIVDSEAITKLSIGALKRGIESRQKDIAESQQRISERYESAQRIIEKTNIEPIRQKFNDAQAKDDWLQNEVNVTDILESHRRSITPNRFVENDQNRPLKQSSGVTLEKKEIQHDGIGYTVYFKDIARDHSTFAIGKDQYGEYTQARVRKDEADQYHLDQVTKNVQGLYESDLSKLEAVYKESQGRKEQGDNESIALARLFSGSGVKLGPILPRGVTSKRKAINAIWDRISKRLNMRDFTLSLKVIDTAADLPKHLNYANNGSGQTQGVYDPSTNTVYVIADAHTKTSEVEETIYHEVVGHIGLAKLMGEFQLSPEFKQIVKLLGGKDGLAKRAKEFGINLDAYLDDVNARIADPSSNFGEKEAELVMLHELVAHLAEQKRFASPIQRIVAKVRSWLRDRGFKWLSKYSNSELLNLVFRAKEAAPTPTPPNRPDPLDGYEGFYRQVEVNELKPVNEVLAAQQKSLVSAIKSALSGGSVRDAVGKNKYAMLTLRQLGEVSGFINKDIGKRILNYRNRVNEMMATQNQLAEEVANLADKSSKWARKNKDKADELFSFMHEATLADVDPSKPFASKKEELKEAINSLNRRYRAFGGSGSERGQEILAEIKELQQQLNKEPDRQNAYKRMRPKYLKLQGDQKQIYKELRDHYIAQRVRYHDALVESINRAVEDGKTRRAALKQAELEFKLAEKGLYFPLHRTGDYWIDFADENGERQFMMYETHAEMKEAVNALSEAGYKVSFGEKLDVEEGSSVPVGFVHDLMEAINNQPINDKYKDQLKDNVYQLYLQSLPTRSIAKNFIHRKGVAGFSNDAVRALADQGFKQSRQQARLEHIDILDNELHLLKKDVELLPSNVELDRLYKEMIKRHEWVKNPNRAAWAQKLTSLGFVWLLGMSPSAALVNLTQNVQVALPILGSRFGYRNASREMGKAAKEFMSAATKQKMQGGELGIIGNYLKGHEKEAFRKAIEHGVIDVTQAHDLIGLAENPTAKYNGFHNAAMNRIGWMFHKAEVANREIAFVTAYRLAYEKYKNSERAFEVASDATWDSHFDYGSLNRARFMQSNAAAVAFQFKQYSQNMTYLLASNVYKSIKGKSKEEKSEALRTLGGVLISTFAIGGVAALPLGVLMGAVNLAQAVFGDDDEPFDLETEMKRMLAGAVGKDFAGAIWYGAAPSLSGRISLNDLWVRQIDRDVTPEQQYIEYMKQLAGPVLGGIAISFAQGLGDIAGDNYYRGVEKMTPKAVRDLLKTARYASEGGINSRTGSQIVDDLSAFDLAGQAIGFSVGDAVKQYDENNAAMRYQTAANDRRQSLMNAYYSAYKMGDQEALEAISAKIQKWNSSKFGRVNPISNDSLRRSIRQRLNNLNKSGSGIRVSDKYRHILNEYDFFN